MARQSKVDKVITPLDGGKRGPITQQNFELAMVLLLQFIQSYEGSDPTYLFISLRDCKVKAFFRSLDKLERIDDGIDNIIAWHKCNYGVITGNDHANGCPIWFNPRDKSDQTHSSECSRQRG